MESFFLVLFRQSCSCGATGPFQFKCFNGNTGRCLCSACRKQSGNISINFNLTCYLMLVLVNYKCWSVLSGFRGSAAGQVLSMSPTLGVLDVVVSLDVWFGTAGCFHAGLTHANVHTVCSPYSSRFIHMYCNLRIFNKANGRFIVHPDRSDP